MDTRSVVRCFQNNFSIDNILSKSNTGKCSEYFSALSDSTKKISKLVKQCKEVEHLQVESESNIEVQSKVDLLASSPISSCTGDGIEDSKSDVASEDGISKSYGSVIRFYIKTKILLEKNLEIQIRKIYVNLSFFIMLFLQNFLSILRLSILNVVNK